MFRDIILWLAGVPTIVIILLALDWCLQLTFLKSPAEARTEGTTPRPSCSVLRMVMEGTFRPRSACVPVPKLGAFCPPAKPRNGAHSPQPSFGI